MLEHHQSLEAMFVEDYNFNSDGDFAARFIYATGTPGGDEVGFKGTASGNLPLSGGTMTGNINFNQDEGGITWARNTG